jgi:hypothetical protein
MVVFLKTNKYAALAQLQQPNLILSLCSATASDSDRAWRGTPDNLIVVGSTAALVPCT